MAESKNLFDRLAKLASAGQSRRDMLRLLTGTAAVALADRFPMLRAWARPSFRQMPVEAFAARDSTMYEVVRRLRIDHHAPVQFIEASAERRVSFQTAGTTLGRLLDETVAQEINYQTREVAGRVVVLPAGRTEFDDKIVNVDIKNVPRAEAVDLYTGYLQRQSSAFLDFTGIVVKGSASAPIYREPVTLRSKGTVLEHLTDLLGDDPGLTFSIHRTESGVLYMSLASVARLIIAPAAGDPCRGLSLTYANQTTPGCDGGACGAKIVFDITAVTVCPGDDCNGKMFTEAVTTDEGCFKGGVATGPGCKVVAGNRMEAGCTDTYSLCNDPKAYPAGGCTETYTQTTSINGRVIEICKLVFTVRKNATSCTGNVTRTCTPQHSPNDCCRGANDFCSTGQCCESPGSCNACDPKTKCCVKDPANAGFSKCVDCDPKTHCCVPDPANPGFKKCQPLNAGKPAPSGKLRSYATTLVCDECCNVTYQITGGGKYLIPSGVASILRLSLSGSTASSDGTSFTDYSGVNGSFSAYNELTRTIITSLSFGSLSGMLLGGGDEQVVADVLASVGGSTRPVTFQAARFNGLESFAIRDAGTGQLLAGGNGEAGRATTSLTITVH